MYSPSQREIGQHDDRVHLEVGAKLFSCHTWRVSAACSRRVYRVYASDKDLLTKNISLCFRFSSSLNKAALTNTSETDK